MYGKKASLRISVFAILCIMAIQPAMGEEIIHQRQPLARLGTATDVAFGPREELLVLAQGHAVKAYDLQTGQSLGQLFNQYDYMNAVDVSPDGQTILGISQNTAQGFIQDATAVLWDIETWRETHTFPIQTIHARARFGFHGNHILTPANSNLNFWDIQTGELAYTYKYDMGEQTFAGNRLSMQGDMVCVVENAGQTMAVYLGLIASETGTHPMAVSPNGEYMLNGGYTMPESEEAGVFLQRTDNYEMVQEYYGTWDYVYSVAFSPAMEYVFAACPYGVYMWERNTGQQVAEFADENIVDVLEISPQANYLASGSSDKLGGQLWLWDISEITHDSSINPTPTITPTPGIIPTPTVPTGINEWRLFR